MVLHVLLLCTNTYIATTLFYKSMMLLAYSITIAICIYVGGMFSVHTETIDLLVNNYNLTLDCIVANHIACIIMYYNHYS